MTIYLQEKFGWKKFECQSINDIEVELKSRNIQIGSYCEIGSGCKIGSGCEIGSYCEIGSGCEIKNGFSLFALNLYKYSSSSYLSKGVEWIQLGCFLRTRQEWESDFWNNDDEFPNNGSEKSEARLRAFDVHCFFLDSLKEKK